MAANNLPFPRRNSIENCPPSTPPQPGLRSFIIYDELPDGCFALEVDDEQTAPHVRRGEFVVVDGSDVEPIAGELFVCAFSTPYPNEKRLRVMEVSNCHYLPGRFLLSEVRPQRLLSLFGPTNEWIKFMDGPYPPEYLSGQLFRGKVIGIYRPNFRRQLAKGG